ncbi:MAG: hypothetical protein M3144_12695, partial [Actinomycetota bacterium]|nr:hypothetical protein [Actinomycetota bacterium]
VQYTTVAGTATAGSDYGHVPPTTLSFAPGETTKTVTVPVMTDAAVEPSETFSLKLSSPVDATISDDAAAATILDDDTPPNVSVADLNVREREVGIRWAVVTFIRRGDSSGSSSVQYATAAGSATDGVDYVGAPPRTVAFGPGETVKTVVLAVSGDTAGETDETFFVNLSSPVGAAIADAQGLVRILNDD